MLSRPILAFGFESLPMLGWLVAAAAPWLIHLLSRRKHRETAWAAMKFLLAAMKRRTRRIRIEQWLLLLIRTGVIILLVTAVAEPHLERTRASLGPNGNTHRVLVIDSSYSMGFKSSGSSRFEQAKQWASQIVEQSPRGDGFTLIQMANPPRIIVATPGVEKDPIRQEIQGLELLHTGADLATTLGEVHRILDSARRDSPRLTRQEVYFFSDLQRGTWMPVGDAAKTEIRTRATSLAATARLKVMNLGQAGDDNLAVTQLDIREPVVLAGQNVALDAGIRDYGHVTRQHQAVDLLVDGRAAGRQYVDIPVGGNQVARFHYTFESSGDHWIEARLAGEPAKSGDPRSLVDGLEVDDHRYLAVHVRQALRVLCVDGRPAGDPRQSSVFYLNVALQSQSDPNNRSQVETETATETAILERNLGNYDCVMLSNVPRFTASEARVLDSYLAHGGSLVFFLGDRVIAENYNSVLADQLRILPAQLDSVAKNPGGRLDPMEYRHPIVQKFQNHENAGLLKTPVGQYFKVKLATSGSDAKKPSITGNRKGQLPSMSEPLAAQAELRSAEVAIALSNGDPLIITQTVRRGRVVLVTTSADTSWSFVPQWGTYEPLVKQILAWCTAGQSQPRNIVVGDPLESRLPASAGLTSVSIERPGGQSRSMPLEVQGDYCTWRYDDTFISGIYSARYSSSLSPSQLFAVNLSTAESDLAPISQEELQNEVWPGVLLEYETAWQGADASLPRSTSNAGQLYVGLLYSVFALLLLETVLAWRFGYTAA
jgi:hypothetical protein